VGFSFANRASPDPQTLDWYEEGRFLPAVEGDEMAGDGTYTVQEAMFTRIGNVVHVALRVGWSAHSGKGGITITGLPYPAAVDTLMMAMLRPGDGSSATTDQASAVVSGTRCALPMLLQPDDPHRIAGRATRYIALAGQYLTTG
jgi:hypothetical protein